MLGIIINGLYVHCTPITLHEQSETQLAIKKKVF